MNPQGIRIINTCIYRSHSSQYQGTYLQVEGVARKQLCLRGSMKGAIPYDHTSYPVESAVGIKGELPGSRSDTFRDNLDGDEKKKYRIK